MHVEHRGSGTQPPGYIRGAGGLTVVLGAMIFIWMPYTGHELAWRGAGIAIVAGGMGLLLGQRWAWPLLFLAAVPFFLAAYVFFLPETETDPFELDHGFGLVFLAVGCLLLVMSATRGTRSWLKGRR
jgi:hypothetical protein